MTREELEAIRKRNSKIPQERYANQAEKDRRAILSYIDELLAENELLRRSGTPTEEIVEWAGSEALKDATEQIDRLTRERDELEARLHRVTTQELRDVADRMQATNLCELDNAYQAEKQARRTAEREWDEARKALEMKGQGEEDMTTQRAREIAKNRRYMTEDECARAITTYAAERETEMIGAAHRFTGNGPGVCGADNCQICFKWHDEHAEWETTPPDKVGEVVRQREAESREKAIRDAAKSLHGTIPGDCSIIAGAMATILALLDTPPASEPESGE